MIPRKPKISMFISQKQLQTLQKSKDFHLSNFHLTEAIYCRLNYCFNKTFLCNDI